MQLRHETSTQNDSGDKRGDTIETKGKYREAWIKSKSERDLDLELEKTE